MRQSEGWVHRGARPWILWCGGILVALGVIGFSLFIWRVGAAVALAFERAAATGSSVPDMSGGLPALLTAIGAFLASAGPFIWRALGDRHRERMDQQARGTAPNAPFAPPSPPGPQPGDIPSGGLVNNQAIE